MRSLADSDPLFDSTVLAHDIATPVEPAVTPLDASLSDDVVAATAAQGAAAVHTLAGPVTLTARRARHVLGGIAFAKVGRLLVVQQVER